MWITQARCTHMPDLFDSILLRDHLKARRLCDSCPLRGECLSTALLQAKARSRSPQGTWGGLLWRKGRPISVSDG